jgi:hypothetical protein
MTANHPEAAPLCPICGALTDKVYDRHERRVFACSRCQTDVIVPLASWHRSASYTQKPSGERARVPSGNA